MTKSILGDLAVRYAEQGMALSRAREGAMGLDSVLEKVLADERLYRQALGLDSASLELYKQASAYSREADSACYKLLEAPLRKAREAVEAPLREANSVYREAVEASLRRANSFYQELIQASLSPLPDFANSAAIPIYEREGISRTFGRLSRAIAKAPVIGRVEAPKEKTEAPEGEESQEAERTLEPTLVKVVPAEVLGQIRVPLNELNRILHHPEAMRQLEARNFESFIATLIEQLGFEDVLLTPASGDQGRDVLATKKFAGIPLMFAFECKRYRADRPVGPEIVRALLGTIGHKHTRANKGVLVTTSTFSPTAREFILTEPALDGKDFDGIVGWLKEYATRRSSS